MSTSDPELDDRSTAGALAAVVRGPLAEDHEHARRLIENVNHHIRTPLTVILGHVDLWRDRDADFPAELRDSLAAVVRAGWRVRDVGVAVCDLIDVSAIRPGTAQPVAVWPLVTDEVATFGDRAAQRDILLVVDGNRTARCVANPSRLQRALRELLDNALTYAPDRSTVRVLVTAAATGIRIAVTDEGEGVGPADRERLVRPFERGTHPRQPVDGLGVGLAVASAIAASHGGRLLLSDGPEGGHQSCLELPVDVRHAPEAEPPDGYSRSRASL